MNYKKLQIEKIRINFIILFFLSVFLIFPIMIFPNDWFAWIIVYITYLIPLFFVKKFKTKIWLFVTWLIISIHHIVAFINSYIGPVLGSDKDALGFMRRAEYIANFSTVKFEVGASLYYNFLALIFKIFNISLFLGSELSVLAFTITLILLLSILSELNIKNHFILFTLLFGLTPSVVFFTSVTLRESFQMLFFSLMCLYALKFYNNKNIKNVLIIFLSALILSFTHNGLMVIVPILILIIILFNIDGEKRKFSFGIKLIIFIICTLLILISFVFINKIGISSVASTAVLEGDIIDYAGQYSTPGNAGGSSYNVYLDTSNFYRLIITLPFVFISYMFAPFVWQIRNFMDIYAFIESVFRLLLVLSMLSYYKKLQRYFKNPFLMLILLVLITELVWATGTQNWGTAMRHHIVTYGVLLVLGIDGISKIIKKIISK